MESHSDDPSMIAPPVSYTRLGLHIFALSGFAIAQPVFSVLSSSTELFVARRTTTLELVVLALALVSFPPAIMMGIVWLVGRFGLSWAWRCGLAFIWILLAMLALQLIAEVGEPAWFVAVLGAVVIASAAMALYVRFAGVREYASLLAIAPLIFLGLFLVGSGASRFVLPGTPVGAVEVAAATDSSVVFLVLDEFPLTSLLDESGTVDADRFPNIAALGERSYWFEYPAAAHVYTTRSFAGLMTGDYSCDGALPTAEDYPNNIFTLMGATHEMHVYEPETNFCPESICETTDIDRQPITELRGLSLTSLEIEKRVLLPQLFDDTVLSLDDPFGVFGGTVSSEAATDEFADRVDSQIAADQVKLWREWLESMDGGSQQFHFRHVFLPHAPYKYLPDGTRYNRESQVIPALDDDGYWRGDEWHTIDAHQRQLLQIQALDMLIGELADRLEALGSYDETMIVITSDHGVSHVPDDARRDLTPGTAAHVGFVPLIIKAPDQSAGVVWSTPISGIDLVPTMADLLTIDVPWDSEGRSVLAEPRSEVRIQTQTGEFQLLEPASLSSAVRFVRDRFPSIPGVHDIYSYGPLQDLLGTPASQHPVESSNLTGVIDDPQLYDDVNLDSGFVPVFVGGSVAGDAGTLQDASVAVVANGQIAAVVPLYEVESRSGRFGAVIPISYLTNGSNEVSLVLVAGSGDAMRLLEVATDGSDAMLRADGESFTVTDAGGSVLANDTAIRGYVDTAGHSDGRVHFSGWAIDEAVLGPADLVMVFVDGLYVATATPDGDREALAADLGVAGYRYSGFAVNLAESTLPPDAAVRVFAVSDGRVNELGFVPEALEALASQG